MPLDQADKDWIVDAMQKAVENKTKELEQKLDNLGPNLGKRVDRLESAFGLMARAARTALVSGAKQRHEQALRGMFDDSALLLIPPLQEDQLGKMSRTPVSCTREQVQAFVADCDAEVPLEVELAKPTGFRILVSSFSPQTRRRVAAQFVKDCKKKALDDLNLLLQYDKPFEIRNLQRSAHKLLGIVKSISNGAVTKKSVKGGYLYVNDVRLAPEYLVPDSSRWDTFAGTLAEVVRQWRGKPPGNYPKDGLLYDLFGAEFAAGCGVFDLNDVQSEDVDAMYE
jgi:hypothetical protein